MRRISQIGSLFSAILTLTIASCVTGEKMSSLSPGMTKDQVVAVLGHPDGYQSEGDSEVLRYTNKLVRGFSWDRADYDPLPATGQGISLAFDECNGVIFCLFCCFLLMKGC
jgi:hypothetical protein